MSSIGSCASATCSTSLASLIELCANVANSWWTRWTRQLEHKQMQPSSRISWLCSLFLLVLPGCSFPTYIQHDIRSMRVFLVRHGETEHNVAGLLAGVTDSRLTNHGLIQAQRLADHLVKKRQLPFSHVFASDLQRAHRTANEICASQNAASEGTPQISTIAVSVLREQDFGSFELLPWNRSQEARRKDPSSEDPAFKPKETAGALKLRADTFLDDYLLPLLALDDEMELNIAVVSHGLFLAALWKAILTRFRPSTVSLAPSAALSTAQRPLERLPGWSNTGFLELEIHSNSDKSGHGSPSATNGPIEPSAINKLDATMKIVNVNGREHLASLKRTRGGVGSSASDEKQKRLESFFKKAKLDTSSKRVLPTKERDSKPAPVSDGTSIGKRLSISSITFQ